VARKFKTFVTSLGFFDLAVAAPSMKAALEAWGLRHNAFHQGTASQTEDPQIVAAAMAKPGVVLRRPVGTAEPFGEDAELPKGFSLPAAARSAPPKAKAKAKANATRSPADRQNEKKDQRAAVISFEKARAERQRALAKEEVAAKRAREKRLAATEKAQRALEDARKDHQSRIDKLERERVGLDLRVQEEHIRWDRERRKLEASVERARRG
jgi:hypothetical protein